MWSRELQCKGLNLQVFSSGKLTRDWYSCGDCSCSCSRGNLQEKSNSGDYCSSQSFHGRCQSGCLVDMNMNSFVQTLLGIAVLKNLASTIWLTCCKVSRPSMNTLSSTPTSRRMRNKQLVRDDSQFQFVSVALCLIIFGAHILFIFEAKILVDIKWSSRTPLPPNHVDYWA